MASADLERSHSAMGSLASPADPLTPPLPKTPTAKSVLERSASSRSPSSSKKVPLQHHQSASERLSQHRSRMHQRRPKLTSTVSVDEGTSSSMSSLAPPAQPQKRATSPFVESSREAAEVRLKVLAEIKALQVRRHDSFKRSGTPIRPRVEVRASLEGKKNRWIFKTAPFKLPAGNPNC
jgi:hypothetical protein